MSSLDWQLGLGLWRWRSLDLLLLLLLLILMVLLLLVHPWSGAIGVMRETVTSWWCWVNGPQGEGLSCLVGAMTLWTAGPRVGEGFALALGVLVREGGMRGVGSAEHAA